MIGVLKFFKNNILFFKYEIYLGRREKIFSALSVECLIYADFIKSVIKIFPKAHLVWLYLFLEKQ